MTDKVYSGFKELSDILENCIKNTDNVIDVLEEGARQFVVDLRKLPKPMSKVRKAGYTHLVNSFSYRNKSKEIEVGWGKYYGPMLEHGTKNMDEQPHVYPLWNKNKDKYYKIMINKLGF